MRAIALKSVIAGIALATAGSAAWGAVNIVPTHTANVSVSGNHGVLRPGSVWNPPAAPSDVNAPVDGVVRLETTLWTDGSFWWDDHPDVNASPLTWEVLFDQSFTFERFAIQADNNENYLLEYWDGSAWAAAWTFPAVPGFGLITRNSDPLALITTDRLRISATGGDSYYAVSELQAFAVPEPETWAMMIAGFGLAGAAIRARRRQMAFAAG